MIILHERSMPIIMGVFRAKVSDFPLFNKKSDNKPPRIPPKKPQRAGREATKPASRMDIPFA